MAQTVCEIMDYDTALVEQAATADFGFTAPRPLESGFVTDRLMDILGYPPILFRNAVFRMIEALE
jgi:dTDP-4-dehydrorhamnose reductase